MISVEHLTKWYGDFKAVDTCPLRLMKAMSMASWVPMEPENLRP